MDVPSLETQRYVRLCLRKAFQFVEDLRKKWKPILRRTRRQAEYRTLVIPLVIFFYKEDSGKTQILGLWNIIKMNLLGLGGSVACRQCPSKICYPKYL